MVLTHIDGDRGVRMVDIGEKDVTDREAVARGRVYFSQGTVSLIAEGDLPKGNVLAAAQIAGIMAAKKTPDLIPLCHNLDISGVNVKVVPDLQRSCVNVEATVRVKGRTGAEMEALTAVSVACLTIYDMCKSVDRHIRIDKVYLHKKSGGKSGTSTWEGDYPWEKA